MREREREREREGTKGEREDGGRGWRTDGRTRAPTTGNRTRKRERHTGARTPKGNGSMCGRVARGALLGHTASGGARDERYGTRDAIELLAVAAVQPRGALLGQTASGGAAPEARARTKICVVHTAQHQGINCVGRRSTAVQTV